MRIDVQLVNFPKSDLIRSLVTNRISNCIDKFADGVSSVKAFFSREGIEHHVKISVVSGKVKTFVSASANDVAHSIDKAVTKLEASLRRIVARNKHHRIEHETVSLADTSKETIEKFRFRKHRSINKFIANSFDKYDSQYASDFEDLDRRRII